MTQDISQNRRKKLIDQVVKLLALAESTTHLPEAESAREKAAEIMAKENIALGDITKADPFVIEDQQETRLKPSIYNSRLYHYIAKFCGVQYLVVSGGRTNAINRYVGRKVDLEVCSYMIGIVIQQREAAWKKYLGEFKTRYLRSPTLGERDRWMLGFAVGVNDKLKSLTKMAEKKIQEWGLVPVDVADQALAWYSQNDPGVKKTGGRAKFSRDGREAGKQTSIHQGLGSTGPTKQLK